MCIFHQALTGSKCFKLLMLFVTEIKSGLKELFFCQFSILFFFHATTGLSKNHGSN